MPVAMTHRELVERQVNQDHVLSKSLTPLPRRLAMFLPLYSCSCGKWDAERTERFYVHIDREIAKRL
jgi:hypothetical protein